MTAALKLILYCCLRHQGSHELVTEKVLLRFNHKDSIRLWSRYESDQSFVQLNNKTFVVRGKMIEELSFRLPTECISMISSNTLMSVRESVTNLNSGKVDDSKLSRLVPGANPESFCALIDRYYIREHCIVDLIANSATNFENYRILSASSKVLHGNQHLLLLMTGKDSTKLVDYSRSKAGVEIIETNFMLSSDAIPISLAYSNNGVLVSAWDSRLNSYQLWSIGQGGKESKLLLQEKGHILGGDDEGYREPSIVSFENGKFFLWCTPSKLIFGESPL